MSGEAHDRPITYFIRGHEKQPSGAGIDSYIARANTANIPYRVIEDSEIAAINVTSGCSFVFPATTPANDVKRVYEEMVSKRSQYFSIYHVYSTSEKRHDTLTKYSNYSSLDIMKDAVIQNILSCYVSNSWNRSVWTYSYILELIRLCGVSIPVIAANIYKELSKHFTKKDGATGKTELIGDYDSVFNATCKMLEILFYFREDYCEEVEQSSSFRIEDVIERADEMVLDRIGEDAVYDQDICYAWMYLIRCGKYESLSEVVQRKLKEMLNRLLATISEEILSMTIDGRSSVDLCRVHLTLCMLAKHNIVTPSRAETYVKQIELVLSERQDAYGNWRNVSETAEISAMLLDSHADRMVIPVSIELMDNMISKGIESLDSQFNPVSNMWGEDIAATAKAMCAMTRYDAIFDFSINDFFAKWRKSPDCMVSLSDEVSYDKINDFYYKIQGLEQKNAKLQNDCDSTRVGHSRLGRRLSAIGLVLTAAVSVLFVTGYTTIELYVNHRAIFDTITGNRWQMVSGAIVSSLVSGLIVVAARLIQTGSSRGEHGR